MLHAVCVHRSEPAVDYIELYHKALKR